MTFVYFIPVWFALVCGALVAAGAFVLGGIYILFRIGTGIGWLIGKAGKAK